MKDIKIEGLAIKKLKQIIDNRGAVFHFIKNSDNEFYSFGEIYFSKINFNIIKGWKYHKKIVQNICVPYGSVKFVIYDNRINSQTNGKIIEIILNSENDYQLLTLPPCVWYSFKGLSNEYSLICNLISETHDLNESKILPLDNNIILQQLHQLTHLLFIVINTKKYSL